jgi:hypothetical protein
MKREYQTVTTELTDDELAAVRAHARAAAVADRPLPATPSLSAPAPAAAAPAPRAGTLQRAKLVEGEEQQDQRHFEARHALISVPFEKTLCNY